MHDNHSKCTICRRPMIIAITFDDEDNLQKGPDFCLTCAMQLWMRGYMENQPKRKPEKIQ